MHIYNYVYIYILNLQQALYQKLAFKPQLSNLPSWCFNFQTWLVSCCQGALHRHPTIGRSFRQMCLAVGPTGGGSVPWIHMGGVSTLNGLKALVSWNKTLVPSKLNLGHLPDFFCRSTSHPYPEMNTTIRMFSLLHGCQWPTDIYCFNYMCSPALLGKLSKCVRRCGIGDAMTSSNDHRNSMRKCLYQDLTCPSTSLQ